MVEDLSVNQLALETVKEMTENEKRLNIEVTKLENGTTLIDCGVKAQGGYEAGLYATKVGLGNLATAYIGERSYGEITLPTLFLSTDHPTLSIAACQYAWIGLFAPPILGEDEEYSAFVSGPARALAQEPEGVFDKIGYKDDFDKGVLLIQSEELPDEDTVEPIATKCGISTEDLYLVIFPTRSLSGSTQVSARSFEDGFWRLTEYCGFESEKVKSMTASTPISPVYPEMWKEPGITPDDMIRNGSRVNFVVESDPDDNLEEIAEEMVIENTPAFGKSFYQILTEGNVFQGGNLEEQASEGNTMVISEANLSDLSTGKMHSAGKEHSKLMKEFFEMR